MIRRTPLKAKTPLRSKSPKTRTVKPVDGPVRPKSIAVDLRKFARGQLCMVRLPGCDGGGDTTVLAHIRLAGTCGTGIKPPDVLGAWACDHCHGVVDDRIKTDMARHEIQMAFYEAGLRTLYEYHQMGLVMARDRTTN